MDVVGVCRDALMMAEGVEAAVVAVMRVAAVEEVVDEVMEEVAVDVTARAADLDEEMVVGPNVGAVKYAKFDCNSLFLNSVHIVFLLFYYNNNSNRPIKVKLIN